MKKQKYGNAKVIVDGIKFDSKLEAKTYQDLQYLVKAKKIEGLELQKTFVLQPSFKCNGKTERAITYKADFYYKQDGKEYCIDAKGFRTEVFKIKRKMFLFKYPHIVFIEVTK